MYITCIIYIFIHVYTHTYLCNNNKRLILRRSREVTREGLEGKKEREEII